MTQRKQIEKHLKRWKSITPLQALKKYNCLRLAVIIQRLRDQDGMRIDTVLIGEKRHAKYILK